MFPQYGAECGFVAKAHPPAHISGYVPVDGTQVAEPQASKMWNYFFPGP
jgi:hypothetical protein